jgi:hypothetical protein
MTIPLHILLLLALGGQSASPKNLYQEQVFYGASVTFKDGVCWFWTGDVGLTAKQFERDLADRFDPKKGIIISYRKATPLKCLRLARRSASSAGFKLVKLVVDQGAGHIGPTLPGS